MKSLLCLPFILLATLAQAGNSYNVGSVQGADAASLYNQLVTAGATVSDGVVSVQDFRCTHNACHGLECEDTPTCKMEDVATGKTLTVAYPLSALMEVELQQIATPYSQAKTGTETWLVNRLDCQLGVDEAATACALAR
ncbi:MAG: hypothetical protein JST16_08030 [Bdellovibrionales bacterium]|nr:hypothetical protein [Bdellovibrionales bacterium]